MPINREKKKEILLKLQKIVRDSISIVFINFHSLPVTESSQIRKTLREKGIGYTVAKKTLTKKALGEGSFSGTMPELPGELGIVYLPADATPASNASHSDAGWHHALQAGGSDSIEPAREIYSFQKKFDKKIQIIGGIFEGKFMNKEEMLVISQIPGLKTLQAQFVNLINSPIQRLVIGLNEIAQKKV